MKKRFSPPVRGFYFCILPSAFCIYFNFMAALVALNDSRHGCLF